VDELTRIVDRSLYRRKSQVARCLMGRPCSVRAMAEVFKANSGY
jgi:hypothetical protein